ncbi:MAG: hypothetical protein AAGD92_07905 [Pseudomonadota bacterium]
MTPRTILISLGFAMTATAACAVGADFEALDTDGSGGLSLLEVQTAAPSVSTEEFAAFDADANGELSKGEFEDWKASKKEPAE